MSLSGNQKTRIGDMGAPGRAYSGFVAKAAAATVIIAGLEYTLPANQAHYTLDENRYHHTLTINRIHYTVDE